MSRGRAAGCAGVALALLAVLVVLLFVACNTGRWRDVGTVTPANPPPGIEGEWTLVEVAGAAWPGRYPAKLVEVDPDGRTATVFFDGGPPTCYALTDVELARHDPEPPTATVSYGLRLGVWGCTADLWRLAVRVPLDPPFAGAP